MPTQLLQYDSESRPIVYSNYPILFKKLPLNYYYTITTFNKIRIRYMFNLFIRDPIRLLDIIQTVVKLIIESQL